MNFDLVALIPWLPALGAIVCGFLCTKPGLRKFAGHVCSLSIALAFALSLVAWRKVSSAENHTFDTTLFYWINVGEFSANFAYFFDPLTILMLMVVTGIGTLISIYAWGYMKGERGYARFFMAVSLFIFAMTNLVMADNLVLLYLGWEGVGLCSYLLIGYYYDKPEAVAAGKKAFIVNRIGDLGFALGIFLIYYAFDTVQISEILEKVKGIIATGVMPVDANMWAVSAIPFLLMLGAFGKSAQFPLYVWLPDAMAGPTPVSALIHAATMVTSGVYMIARLFPLFDPVFSPYALPVVATVGAFTALFAGTMALCQYDLKKIFAYSTVSQLGYMFLGLGAMSTVGATFHLMTHAFFKALLFLTAGSVMHALAGNLDLRTMSGLRKKMPVTCWLMLAGSLALAGFPFTAGFFSKDTILAAAMAKGLDPENPFSSLYMLLAISGLITAFLTALYTFRLWFRVFLGEERWEMGHESHGADDAHGHDAHGHGDAHGHAHEPHEMPWSMNWPLVVLAVGALLAGIVMAGPMKGIIANSTAAQPEEYHPHGMDLHVVMMVVSSIIALLGIAVAAWFHLLNRHAATEMARRFSGIVKVLGNKYYIDEIYDAGIVKPLRVVAYVFSYVDRLLLHGIVELVGFVPKLVGRTAIQPAQMGKLQGYGLGMLAGVAILVLVVKAAVSS
jgi:NADH-quinone oxidoreductase subunit L